MENISKDKSTIWISKSKFFFVRILIYFSFLLIPIFLPKSLYFNQGTQAIFMALYILFMISQWFFLGKEIDHRFNIYFQIHSSMERIIYRILIGKFFFIMYFNIISFLPSKWIDNIFWSTWGALGLFYSWPTRGKIIRESISTNFSEFRYLDRFEKTMIGLILILFIVSFPGIPKESYQGMLRLFFDPLNQTGLHLWSFLRVNYFPFHKYPELFKIAWSMHFYLVGIGFFLIAFYAFLRLFFSRRLSLLGLFAFLSSWPFYQILISNQGMSYYSTYSLFWIWGLIWAAKSLTYKTGLFLGLLGYYGCLINRSWILLPLAQTVLIYFFFLKDSTIWFRRQFLKYTLWGIFMCLLLILSHSSFFSHASPLRFDYVENLKEMFNRKGFFVISFFGVGILFLKYAFSYKKYILDFKINDSQIKQVLISMLTLSIYSLTIDSSLLDNFSLIWMIVFFSLIPLELIFQKISRQRSRRNIIYLIYILICLLDSRFEERVKVILKNFNF